MCGPGRGGEGDGDGDDAEEREEGRGEAVQHQHQDLGVLMHLLVFFCRRGYRSGCDTFVLILSLLEKNS